ncbi:hypothetical protein MKZ38_004083 [Zalerion maritima]|uniref:MYND-type domain-containing protein n=1 Tax=Zalerion maritima TaxID=339359 RepID=A0AAD5RWP6_9PEZI|nr:hypothetical protein MKZ38_004083 [Zalerion maritima]
MSSESEYPYTGFLDNTNFPPYSHLPMVGELSFDPDNPEEHWCYLGEIVEEPFPMRARTMVQDIEGKKIVLAFYPDNNVPGPDLSKMKVGHTIAIFYPTEHFFLDGTQGIRVEEMKYVKMFPLSIDNMFRASLDILEYNTPEDGKLLCHGCDQRKQGLSKCGKCGFFFYCGRDCQAKGWTDKKHKKFCKTLRDPDFRRMLEWKYVPFESPRFRFSSFSV